MSVLLFSKNHLWIQIEDTIATLGISHYAQERLGNILFVNLPDLDEELKIGKVFGDIESGKTVSDLISPVDGTVIAVNEELMDEPDRIHTEPYHSWFVKIKVKEKSEEWMNENQYKEYLKTL